MGAELPRASGFEVFQRWSADVASRKGESTVRAYRRQVFSTLADLGADPLQIDSARLRRYLSNLPPRWSGEIRKGLKDFFGFLVRRGYRSSDPMAEVKPPRTSKRRVRRGLSEDELTRLVVAAVGASQNPRYEGEKVAWGILAEYGLGLRPGELVRLSPSKIHLNGSSSCVYVTDTKTGHDRVIPINRVAKEALEELLRKRVGEGSMLGMGVSQWHGKVSAAARLAHLPPEKSRPYALRHTFATHMIERGVHQRVVAELLGHSDLRTVSLYTIPADDEMRKAVEVLG